MIKSRLEEVDGLRGIAALVVLVFHYLFLYNNLYGHGLSVPEIIRYGQYGVHLFFMISGFVIFWTISNSAKPLDFVWSRFSRLYPVFWVSVILTFTIVSLNGLPGREADFLSFLVNLTMLHEYFGVGNVDGVYWTLTLELAFYFWMFLFMRLGLLKQIDGILLFWVGIAGLISYRKLGIEPHHVLNKLFILDYIELFAMGICLYKIKNAMHNLLTYGVVMLCVLSLFSKYSNELALGLSLTYGLFYLACTGRARFLAIRPMVFLGTISYSLYLTHQNIGYVLLNYLKSIGLSPVISIILTSIGAIVLATVLTKFVEKPSLKKLRAFYKNRQEQSLKLEKA